MAAAVPATTTPDPSPDEAVRIRRITVEEYHRMLEAGILHEREPVELLDGQLIAMPPEGPLHGAAVSRLNAEMVRRFTGRAVVRPGNALRLSETSEPQPDLALVRHRDDWYERALPGPSDIFLVVEVSLSTLAYDRSDKLYAYASAGVAEVWIVDLVHRRVEVHAEPGEAGYGSTRVAGRDDTVAPRAFPDDAIRVASFMP
jgi:Uma2 family endonuclease